MKKTYLPVVGCIACLIIANFVFSQGAGSAYSGNPYGYSNPYQNNPRQPENPGLDRETAKEVISVDGAAELKVVPDKIRLVFGVISLEETARQCSLEIKKVCDATTEGIKNLGIVDGDINQDFISVTPVFDWKETMLEKEKAIKQVQTGYQMQSNFHVLCRGESEAMQVIDIAFANGISDIIAFDYWSSKLDDAKVETRALAMDSAKKKALAMFETFGIKPRVINIQEDTTVHKPAGLYRTFSNSNSTSVSLPRSWRDRFQIFAARPKLTYLENLEGEKDVHATKPSMKPEISVLSRVTVYYEAPVGTPRLD